MVVGAKGSPLQLILSSVYHIDGSAMTPSLPQLSSYDAVLVFTSGVGFLDNVTLGDNLADYVDNWGGVVVGTFGTYRDAEEHSDQLFIKGFYTKFGYISQTKIYYVYIFESEDFQEAKDADVQKQAPAESVFPGCLKPPPERLRYRLRRRR